MNKWHIFFISGVAGAGKWTVIKKLLEKNIENFELALSCKTRDYRDWEKQWVDYHKLSVEEFKKSIEEGDFLEYNFIHNQNYYGTKYTARLYGIRKDFVTVFYDGKCGLCSREINHYKKIAPNGKYHINNWF